MKLIDRKTFLTTPPGTLFSEYEIQNNNCGFISDLKIKGQTVSESYYELQINDSVDVEVYNIYGMKLGDQIPIDLDEWFKDSEIFDHIHYLVWDENDVKTLIKVLQSSLEKSQDKIMNKFPEVGSIWVNNRQQKLYTVYGIVSPCSENDDWEILYRDEEWEVGQFRRRPLSEWFGKNRHGEVRFTLMGKGS